MRALLVAGFGVALILAGLAWVYPPLAVIVAGAGLLAGGLLYDGGSE